MTQKIGFLGSDNSHVERFSEILNVVDHPDYWSESGATVWSIWGEDADLSATMAERGRIPVVASSPEQVVAESDMVFVITRQPGKHLEYARPAIEGRKPLYVEKPITETPSEAIELLSLVQESGIIMTSFSTLRYGSDTVRYGERLRRAGPVRYATYVGPASRASPYGGIIFYAIHTIELMLHHHGADVVSVFAIEHPAGAQKSNIIATCSYRDGTLVTLALIGDGAYHFHMMAIGRDKEVDVGIETEDYYPRGLRKLLPVLRGEEENPISHAQMLRTIQIGVAIEESLRRGVAVDPQSLK